ncbi:MAG: ABC transporter permease [Euryarchaeota archaeon]|nr:ABC transporter permease [Euryarchaeota archaeon]
MSPRRVLAFTKRTLLQFRHDRRTLAFVLAMPLLMVALFGYTFGGEVKGVKVQVLNADVGMFAPVNFTLPLNLEVNVGNGIVANLNYETLTISNVTDAAAARQDVDKGVVWAAIIIPEGFTRDIATALLNQSAPRPSIEVYIDGSNPNIAAAVFKSVNTALAAALQEAVSAIGGRNASLPASVEPVYAYGGGDTKFVDYFAPGVISFAIMMVTTMITIILFVNERKNGTLQRLMASPASEWEIVTGYALAFGLIGLVQSVVILTAAMLLFNIQIVGNVVLALAVIMLIAFGHQGLGILMSAGAKNELQAVQFVPLILFPSVLLAGLFWPVESIPAYLQPLAYLIPLRYGIDAERSIMLRGWGVGEVWLDLAVLVGFAALTLCASALLLKRRR